MRPMTGSGQFATEAGKAKTHARLLRPKSGQARRCLAKSALCQEETHALQQTCLQSITLSARRWNDAGIVRPNALAVQTLITNSNFVGCDIGKSPGFEPFRIRPA
jgi:hypothetical protein